MPAALLLSLQYSGVFLAHPPVRSSSSQSRGDRME
uniref:Uncharacterized protein n=1 Tax=Arundo donax TaxID=35708 RepID=A0A0A8YKV1_ARUDO